MKLWCLGAFPRALGRGTDGLENRLQVIGEPWVRQGAILQDAEHLMQWTATPRRHAGAWVVLRVDNQEGGPLPVKHEDLLMAGHRLPGLLRDPNVLRADCPHTPAIARPYALVRFRTARYWPSAS